MTRTAALLLAFLVLAPRAGAQDALAGAFGQAAQAVAPATAPCHRLSRAVLWKPMGAPPSEYKLWGRWDSYVSVDNASSIAGILTPWSNKVRAFRFWAVDLVPSDRELSCTLSLESAPFPLDDADHTVWTRRQVFKAGSSFVFENTAADASDPRDFRVTIDWARVADPALCAVPRPPVLP